MKIAIDFDSTIVRADRHYEDVTTPLQFLLGAKEGLYALKRARHLLLLWSGRASRNLLENPTLDPFVRAGVSRFNWETWTRMLEINRARHQQMLDFAAVELPGVFDAIDDGRSGKPSVDLFLDDKAFRMGQGAFAVDWAHVARMYGEPDVRRETHVA